MYAPFLIWGDGRHLRLPFLLSASTNLDFTAEQQSRQMPYAPRRATTTRNISLTLQRKASLWSQHSQPTRIHSFIRLSLPPVPACDRRARVQRKDLVGSRSGATTRIARLPLLLEL